MTDKARNDRREEPGTQAGQAERSSGGDGDRSARRSGPSTHTVDEGLEGAIFDSDPRPRHRPTGAGSEAAEGIHEAGADRSNTDADATDAREAAKGDSRRQGSEPLEHRDATHNSSYGGEMGEPRSAG